MATRAGSAARALELAAATAADEVSLHAAVVEHVQRLTDCGPVFLAAVDPTSLHFTSATRHGIDDEAAAAFLAHEIGARDVVKFRDLAQSPRPVASLYNATDGKPQQSARWREVIEPLGWGDELRVALRVGGRTWGFLCLHRRAGDALYDETDLMAVADVAPVLAEAFRRTAQSSPPAGPGPATGVVVLDEHFVVTSMTGAAAEWLDLLGGSPPGLPIMVMSLAAQAVATGSTQIVRTISADRRWITVHASPLHGVGRERVAVVLECAHPTDALPALAAAIRLTPRELEVAQAILQGLTDRAIAHRLGLRERTVQDHLKAIYAKAAVRSRGELVARLLTT